MREVIVIRSVTICKKRKMFSECVKTDGGGGEGQVGEGEHEGELGLTRLSNVLRLPTNTMSPSTKYAYSV